MRIAILTFAKAINYGAALQAAALQKKLKEYCKYVYFLDHNCKALQKDNSVFDLSRAFNFKYACAHLYNLPCAIKRYKKFKEFQNKYMSFAGDIPENFNAVIVGSDQVWNYDLTNNDWCYFLNFENQNIKKIAYAASLGLKAVPPSKKSLIGKMLDSFDKISVREQSTVHILKELTKKDITQTLDPTLLLTPKEWKDFFNTKATKKYIFVYTVSQSDTLWEFAQKLSNITGLSIKCISYSKLHRKKAEYCFSASPEAWLNTLYNAQYVVTNSFHGIAFSINFSKQFFYEQKDSLNTTSRINDIVERYNLSDREISRCDISKIIDFLPIQTALSRDRLLSEEFIKQSLE